MKDDIGTLGESYGWDVCTSGFSDRFDCEWLYDLVWYKNNDDGDLVEVYLVLESEWSEYEKELKDDFQKLLLAKAHLKVMVFETNHLHIKRLLDVMERGIQVFRPRAADEAYILAGFNYSSYEFEVRTVRMLA